MKSNTIVHFQITKTIYTHLLAIYIFFLFCSMLSSICLLNIYYFINLYLLYLFTILTFCNHMLRSHANIFIIIFIIFTIRNVQVFYTVKSILIYFINFFFYCLMFKVSFRVRKIFTYICLVFLNCLGTFIYLVTYLFHK